MGKAAWMRETMARRQEVLAQKLEIERLNAENQELRELVKLMENSIPAPAEAKKGPGRPRKAQEE